MSEPVSEDDLHAWLDGQLPAARRAEVEAWLRAHPRDAARVEGWRCDAAALRAALAGQALPDAPGLSPRALRRRTAARKRARVGMAAALVLSLGCGSLLGWQARGRQEAAGNPPMADAVAAYRLFAGDGAPLAFDGGGHAAMQDWLRAHFGKTGAIPDLTSQGYALAGGRLLSTPEGPAAMLVYRDAGDARIALYLRPRTARLAQPGERRDGRLLAQYWVEGSTAFALVGPATDAALRRLAPLLRGDA
ncbi:anti-sigma factor [Thermomonas brevis]|uniref:Anti-sigma factor n=1 Tax=Thermomonas brevis TaxID=215691 RepID=A0A7G9QQ31_9GAMM|nr:anti-sigma factor [Thermomonas brevis]QNN45456.1 anti-sigma factor [Thermomonas brevis]